MAAADLQALAEAVLDASEDILATTGNPPIERAFVCIGPPALDCCNQLAVNVGNIGEAATVIPNVLQPGLRHEFSRVNLTALLITVTRCYAMPDDEGIPPSPAEQNADAAVLNADAWALWNGLYRMREVLFSDCDIVIFDGIIPLPPSGGCAGYVMQVRFELEGYAPPVGS